MSAYEEAWNAFRGVVDDVELDRLLTGVERETAHDCAEKIREAAQGDPVTGLCPKVSTAKGAARLIDPEVSDR